MSTEIYDIYERYQTLEKERIALATRSAEIKNLLREARHRIGKAIAEKYAEVSVVMTINGRPRMLKAYKPGGSILMDGSPGHQPLYDFTDMGVTVLKEPK